METMTKLNPPDPFEKFVLWEDYLDQWEYCDREGCSHRPDFNEWLAEEIRALRDDADHLNSDELRYLADLLQDRDTLALGVVWFENHRPSVTNDTPLRT